MAVSEPLTLPDQLRSMRQSVDADTGAILFRHPTLQGIPLIRSVLPPERSPETLLANTYSEAWDPARAAALGTCCFVVWPFRTVRTESQNASSAMVPRTGRFPSRFPWIDATICDHQSQHVLR